MGFKQDEYFCVNNTWFPRDYEWIQYPCQSFPSGGVFNKPPSFYQDYAKEKQKYREKFRKAQEEEQREKFRRFFHRFTQGFFGFEGQSDSECEIQKDDEYPYSVFGLKRSASEEDMKKAYRKSVLKAHPDKGGSAELFRKVREAWEYFSQRCSANQRPNIF